MRALVAVASLNSGGGIESALVNFLRSLRHPDVQVDVCVFDTPNGDLIPAVEALGCRVWHCPLYKNPLKFVARFEAALRRQGRYDVIHNHAGDFAGPMLTAARRIGIPVRIAHYHNVSAGHRNDWKRRAYHAWIRRYVLRDATAIVGCSWAALKSWFPREWATDSRMCVVRCGIDLGRFGAEADGGAVRRALGIPADAPVIGHVGRFVWQKNHLGLIEAAQRVIAQRPDVRFLLVGAGPLEGQVRARVAELGLQERVIFAGQQADVGPYLAAMDAFTLPSVSEGFGLAAVEAQCAGVPVAVSRLPGPLEAAAPELSRYSFAAGDPGEMADSLLRLLGDAARLPALGAAARVHASRFGLDATTDQLLSVWGYETATVAERVGVAESGVAAVVNSASDAGSPVLAPTAAAPPMATRPRRAAA
ncbi:MAG: glycosyltransferase [Phycisphaerales bacterium]|nr:glycosyltransferase [Phycisphaerales bacterium]